ncbi:MAG: cellulase family glycosylhydrolase [Ruminococcus sp.]|nr:cellulase family glycosylhydrolase [Ruminococcus sp.]
MKKRITALFSASLLAVSLTGCGNNKNKSDGYIQSTFNTKARTANNQTSEEESSEEITEEPTTLHVSPIETVSAEVGTQVPVDKVIEKTNGKNTIKLSLSDFGIEDGDVISSFTFVIYSADNLNIGQFKGGCGISVTEDYPSEDEGWYQSPDFTASTQGTYGEIKWDVPSDVSKCVSADGEVLFGYWWGNTSSIRIENATCTYTRTKDLSVDGTVSAEVGQSVGYNDADNTIKVKTADFMPENTIPQAVTFNISSSGGFGKFTGAFGYKSSAGKYQSSDTSVFTESPSLSLTWFVPQEAKNLISEDGEIMLGYWWSEQPSVTLDSIEVKYSLGNGSPPASAKNSELDKDDPTPSDKPSESTEKFRSPSEITDAINVGWNLGNSLDSYNTDKTGLSTETSWGNLKTTEEMIKDVKLSGFNAVRIPVTWGEHMDGNVIQTEWLDRIQEVVDYAYNNDMFVILNMHHDDYIWFNPTDSEYQNDSRKLCAIWEQIAERFKDYGDRLLFEGMNEPRTIESEKEWIGGTPEERAVINKYEQDFINTVRASGGNNSERTLIITSYAASAETVAIDDINIPDDKNIIVSVHYYAPWKFSEGIDSSFTDEGKTELDNKFAELKEKFIDKGTTVIIGEFGCVNATDNATRAEYYQYYVSSAKANGIKCFVWDNGKASGESSFGIFNRGSLSWNEEILNGIVAGASE